MSAFWKKDKEKSTLGVEKRNSDKKVAKDKVAKVNVKNKKEKKSSKKGKGLIIPEDKAFLINKILVQPMISEAVMNAQEMGKYTFEVTKDATKNEITLAIESLYKVSVVKVNVMNYKPQSKFFRGIKGKSKRYKKAIITLKKGDKIKLFS